MDAWERIKQLTDEAKQTPEGQAFLTAGFEIWPIGAISRHGARSSMRSRASNVGSLTLKVLRIHWTPYNFPLITGQLGLWITRAQSTLR